MTARPSMPTPGGVSRRTMIGAAAWSVPVITVATAAPAFAGSNDGWSVTSTSYEGTPAGVRNTAGTYQFQFAIAVPVRATVQAPQGVFVFATGVSLAGVPDGTTVADVSTATGFNPRDVNGVSCLGLNPVTGLGRTTNQFRSFKFSYPYDLPGPTTGTAPAIYPYSFEMTGVSAADANGAMLVFSAANSTIHRNIAFKILAANNAKTYITEPA